MLRISLLVVILFAIVSVALLAREHHHAAEKEDSEKSGPRRQIVKEHDVTLLIVSAAEEEARSIHETGEVDAERLRKMLDFFQNFTDRCHHAKEERYLFPVARAYGDESVAALLDDLINEHKRGRMDLQVIGYLLDTDPEGSAQMIAARLEAYTRMLRVHIRKENGLLLPPADACTPAGDMAAVMVAFDYLEKEELGEGFHEQYHELAMDLAGGGG
jgi:hemerythrin-like domain-containing protein